MNVGFEKVVRWLTAVTRHKQIADTMLASAWYRRYDKRQALACDISAPTDPGDIAILPGSYIAPVALPRWPYRRNTSVNICVPYAQSGTRGQWISVHTSTHTHTHTHAQTHTFWRYIKEGVNPESKKLPNRTKYMVAQQTSSCVLRAERACWVRLPGYLTRREPTRGELRTPRSLACILCVYEPLGFSN